jgi:hypothetical protein
MSGTLPNEHLVARLGGGALNNAEPMTQWLNNQAEEGWTLITVSDGVCYFTRTLAAPRNLTVPAVIQNGDMLHCTMGEWTGHPTAYAYQWQIDGVDAGTSSPDYDASADGGKSATCVVSATNAAGTGTAPPSDAVVIAGERHETTRRAADQGQAGGGQGHESHAPQAGHQSADGSAAHASHAHGAHQGQGARH